ncbi:YqhA family protein [Roseibium salinum]|uniref:YqhA family protein n=1 Tax=Roseibium salinum TaxID=1604349 RepID=A0ABT3R5A0_9HYPH|nr:YqhA family protein [Roseibium sp. DSM 29163]MCX2724476.1 YqhA family protein [Roseibium sp. DSM 29163]
MTLKNLERGLIWSTRYLTIVAALGSLAGALLMFFLGSYNVYVAFRDVFKPGAENDVFGASAIIAVIESLDRFLIALVLLYFAYGVYSLFIHPEEPEEEYSLPAWLRVRQIGQLKQVVAELIVVILFVLFLRQALQAFSTVNINLEWNEIATLLLLPASTVLLGLALRLVQLHPKAPANHQDMEQGDDTRKGRESS